jgi:macrodomain Ter protein organizer (MatP/YcbG family)
MALAPIRVRLSRDLRARLVTYAKRRGMTLSAAVRFIVSDYFARRREAGIKPAR